MISVVMSCYNEKKEEIKKSIDSILKQTFKDFEFIIVLDNPNNTELKKLLQYYKKKDNRIKIVINDTNIGLAMSLNKGIEKSKFDIIARMDADDISMCDRFEKEYNYLLSHRDISLISSRVIVIDEYDKEIRKRFPSFVNDKYIHKALNKGNFISHPCAMFRKKDYIDVGGYRDFPTTQDYDLWLRFAEKEYKFHILNECLLKYRERREGISVEKAYLQFLCQNYIQMIHLKRINTKKDDFSRKDLYSFLEKNEYKSQKKMKEYNKARNELNEANNCIRSFKIIKFVDHYFKMKKIEPRLKKVFWNNIYIKLLSYLI